MLLLTLAATVAHPGVVGGTGFGAAFGAGFTHYCRRGFDMAQRACAQLQRNVDKADEIKSLLTKFEIMQALRTEHGQQPLSMQEDNARMQRLAARIYDSIAMMSARHQKFTPSCRGASELVMSLTTHTEALNTDVSDLQNWITAAIKDRRLPEKVDTDTFDKASTKVEDKIAKLHKKKLEALTESASHCWLGCWPKTRSKKHRSAKSRSRKSAQPKQFRNS